MTLQTSQQTPGARPLPDLGHLVRKEENDPRARLNTGTSLFKPNPLQITSARATSAPNTHIWLKQTPARPSALESVCTGRYPQQAPVPARPDVYARGQDLNNPNQGATMPSRTSRAEGRHARVSQAA